MKKDCRSPSPLVVFGFDAGDPGLLHRWGMDGTLPTLGAIMERGCWGRTAGPEMFCEHGMWVSLMSGVSRSKHGYHYFRQLVPGTYDLAPARGRFLDVEPFWRRLDGNKRVAVIDVPDIAAPKPQSGIQLSEWATHYPYFEASTFPAELLQRIERIFRSSQGHPRRAGVDRRGGSRDLSTTDGACSQEGGALPRAAHRRPASISLSWSSGNATRAGINSGSTLSKAMTRRRSPQR